MEVEKVERVLGMERYLVPAPPAHDRRGEVLGDTTHRVSHLRRRPRRGLAAGGGTEHALFPQKEREEKLLTISDMTARSGSSTIGDRVPS
jgi:hypothetical protein